MTAIPAIFLDDGGVMNDSARRSPQWQRLVAQFFAPRLGGVTAAWMEANRIVFEQMLSGDRLEESMRAARSYAEFDRRYQLEWLGGMCDLVGVDRPEEGEALRLAHTITRAIPPQVDSAFPGAVDAIRTLHADGYVLHTASGEASTDLHGYLTGMGVRECFGNLYGPDLIEAFKFGTEYYERIFADAAVPAEEAVVVDDSPRVLRWASEVGARTVLVGSGSDHHIWATIEGLRDLPALLDSNHWSRSS